MNNSLENIKLMYGCPVVDWKDINKKECVKISESNNDSVTTEFRRFLREVVKDEGINELVRETDLDNIEFDYDREIDYYLHKLTDALKSDTPNSVQRSLRIWKMIYLLKIGFYISKHSDEYLDLAKTIK